MNPDAHSELLTDLSLEVADFWVEVLRMKPEKSKRLFGVLLEKIGAEKEKLLAPELIGALAARIRRLARQVDQSTDRHLTARLRADVTAKLNTLLGILTPLEIWQPWEGLKEKISAADMQVVASVSGAIQLTHPLRRLDDDERAAILEDVDASIATVTADPDLPDWARSILVEGAERLRLVIQYLPAFGHEVAIDHIISFERQVAHTAAHYEDRPGQRKPKSLKDLAASLAMVAGAFCLPYEVYQAGTAYFGGAQSCYGLLVQIEQSQQPKNNENQMPMLPAPSDATRKPEREGVEE